MTEIDARFLWIDGSMTLSADESDPGAHLNVADSFLVSEGKSLAVDLHRARFAGSAERAGYLGDDLAEFYSAGQSLVPAEIDWFPRFELLSSSGSWELAFRLRSAPVLESTAILWTYPGLDPRTEPRTKGPDLPAMIRLRRAAIEHGAREAVILEDGLVAEGSTSALMWWRDGTLFTPPETLARVDSVTAASILTIAQATRVPVAAESATPAELAGTDLWIVNALHGIRPVTRWIDGPALSPDIARSRQWQRRLRALARPLSA